MVSVYATLDNTAPSISGMIISSGDSKEYRAGNPIDFAVGFSEEVVVTGTPRIPLTIGSHTRHADYQSGSGSRELVFRYTVRGCSGGSCSSADFDDNNGIDITSPINSGTIKDSAGNDATRTFTPPSNTLTVKGALPNIVISETDLQVGENGQTTTYTVKLINRPPTANVTVTLTTGDDTVATVSPATLTFTTGNWNNPQTVTVTGVNDHIDNDVKGRDGRTTTITHAISSTDTDYNSLTPSSVNVASRDDDNIGHIV